jgi:hypothetical protein
VTKEIESSVDSRLVPENAFLEADRILHFARECQITIRLLGGIGVWFSSPSAAKPPYARQYNDLDFVALRRQSAKVESLFSDLGYRTKGLFNKLQGDSRLQFFDERDDRRVDIFLDKFSMCHEFDFRDRLELAERTLSPADLLLTKLQVVEINKKDILDSVVLVLDNPLADGNRVKGQFVEKNRIVSMAASDWGNYRTFSMNIRKILEMLPSMQIPEADKSKVTRRLSDLLKAIEDSPKSMSWKLRARVGDNVRWYVLPEAT